MIKTLGNIMKQDREKFTVPRKVQDMIPVRKIFSDGIFLSSACIAKCPACACGTSGRQVHAV